MDPVRLHPAFDPDVQYASGPASEPLTLDQQMLAEFDQQVAYEVRSLQAQEQSAMQVVRFVDLLLEVRSEQQALRTRMDRLLSIIAGE